jgi:hypothetical protein
MYGELPDSYYHAHEREVPTNTYVPGVDFDPDDEGDVESVKFASEWDRFHSLEAANLRVEQLERLLDYHDMND